MLALFFQLKKVIKIQIHNICFNLPSSMAIEQAILTWIHLIAAAIWVGGSIFIGVVFSPILKTLTTSIEERIQIMIKVGKRFNKIAIPSLIILMVTGLYTSYSLLINPNLLLATNYGIFLIIKITLVIALIITYVIHVRVIRKEVEDKIILKKMDIQEIQKLRKKIIILGEITVVLSVAILFFAALLDAGG